MQESGPLISVIIPAYNRERFLGEAIESALAQDYRPLEIIVVDDGSTDGTAAVAQRFGPPVRYAFQPNAGPGAARNRGVELSRGSLLAFLDSDDRWVEGKLARQVAALEAEPDLDAVFGYARQLHEGPEWQQGIRQTECDRSQLIAGMVLGTMLIRRAGFLRVGLFLTDCTFGEFIDWYARAQEIGVRVKTLPDLMLWRRIHDSNLGIEEHGSRPDYARVLKAALERRRTAAREK